MSRYRQARDVDCLVLGGGITGAGVARDAALRGLSVMLVDSNDFASGTSHVTSKVIHGGLRYLEHGHIRPVIEGIRERNRLLYRLAPNLIRPMKFVIPFEGHRFPKWLATLCGLQLYGLPEWYSCGRSSNPMLGVRLRRDYPMMRPHPFAVTFWDAQTNDARLVLSVLRTAEAYGALLGNYTTLESAGWDGQAWEVGLHSDAHGFSNTVRAKTVVNATGPWSPLTAELLGVTPIELMWIKGSHILLPRFARFGNDAIVIRSVRDRRPMWVIPWRNRLIVGATESRFRGDLRDIRASADEIDDLFSSFAHYFPATGVGRGDIECAYAGVRPIVPQAKESANSLSREHRIEVDASRRLVTILGGKLTTFRSMAEQAVDEVDRMLSRDTPPHWLRRRLRNAMLWPGLEPAEAKRLQADLRTLYPRPPQVDTIDHLVRSYGWDASLMLKEMRQNPRLAQPLCDSLPYTLAELGYLCRTEKVCHLVDLLKRRTPIYFLGHRGGDEVLSSIAEHVGPMLGWDAARRADEMVAVRAERRADMQACGEQEPLRSHAAVTVCA